VIVVCEQCQAKYQYDEARFEGRPAKRLRCSRCQAIFEVVNTRAFEAGPALGRRPPPDETFSRRPADKRSRAERPAPRPASELALPAGQKLSLAVIAGPDAGRAIRSGTRSINGSRSRGQRSRSRPLTRRLCEADGFIRRFRRASRRRFASSRIRIPRLGANRGSACAMGSAKR